MFGGVLVAVLGVLVQMGVDIVDNRCEIVINGGGDIKGVGFF